MRTAVRQELLEQLRGIRIQNRIVRIGVFPARTRGPDRTVPIRRPEKGQNWDRMNKVGFSFSYNLINMKASMHERRRILEEREGKNKSRDNYQRKGKSYVNCRGGLMHIVGCAFSKA